MFLISKAGPLPCCQDNGTQTLENDSIHHCENNSHHHHDSSRSKRAPNFANFTNSVKNAAISVGRKMHIINKREDSLPEKQSEYQTILEDGNTKNTTVKRQINIVENKSKDIQDTTVTFKRQTPNLDNITLTTQNNTNIKRHNLGQPMAKRHIPTETNEPTSGSNNDNPATQNTIKSDSKNNTHPDKNITEIKELVSDKRTKTRRQAFYFRDGTPGFHNRYTTRRQKNRVRDDTSSSSDNSTAQPNLNQTTLETAKKKDTKTKRDVYRNEVLIERDKARNKTRRDISGGKNVAEQIEPNIRIRRYFFNESAVEQERLANKTKTDRSKNGTTVEEEVNKKMKREISNNRTSEEKENVNNKTRREITNDVEREKTDNKTIGEISSSSTAAHDEENNETRTDEPKNETSPEKGKLSNKRRRDISIAGQENMANKTKREISKNDTTAKIETEQNKTQEDTPKNESKAEHAANGDRTRRNISGNETTVEQKKVKCKSKREISKNETIVKQEKMQNKAKREQEKISDKTKINILKNETIAVQGKKQNGVDLHNKARREACNNETTAKPTKEDDTISRGRPRREASAKQAKISNRIKKNISYNGTTVGQEEVNDETKTEILKNKTTPELVEVSIRTRRDIPKNETSSDQVKTRNISRRDISKNETTPEQVKARNITRRDVSKNKTTSDQVEVTNITRRENSKNETTPEQVVASNITRRDIPKNETSSDQIVARNIARRDISKNETLAKQVNVSNITRRDFSENETSSDQFNVRNITRREISKNETNPEQFEISNITRRHIPKNDTSSVQVNAKNMTRRDIPKNETTSDQVKVSNITRRDVSKNETTPEQVEAGNITRRDIPKDETSSDQVNARNITRRDISKNGTTPEQVKVSNITRRDIAKNETSSDQVNARNITRRDISKNETTPEQVKISNITRRDVSTNETTPEQVEAGNITRRDISKNETTQEQVKVSNITKREVAKNETTSEKDKASNINRRDISKNETTAGTEKVNDKTRRDIPINGTAPESEGQTIKDKASRNILEHKRIVRDGRINERTKRRILENDGFDEQEHINHGVRKIDNKNETSAAEINNKTRKDIQNNKAEQEISKGETSKNGTITEQEETVNRTQRQISENGILTTKGASDFKEGLFNPEYGRKLQKCLTHIFITVIKPNCSLPGSSSSDNSEDDCSKFINANSYRIKRQSSAITTFNKTYRHNSVNESLNGHGSDKTGKNVTILRARSSEIDDSESVENILIQIGNRKRSVFEIKPNQMLRRVKRNLNTNNIETNNQTKERTYDLRNHIPLSANSTIKKRSSDGYKNITIQIQRFRLDNDEAHRKIRSIPNISANVNETMFKASEKEKPQENSTLDPRTLDNVTQIDNSQMQKVSRRRRYKLDSTIKSTKNFAESQTNTHISSKNVSTENNLSNRTKSADYHHHHSRSRRDTAEKETNSTNISEKDISRDDRSVRINHTKNAINIRENSISPRQGVYKQLDSRYLHYGKNGSRPHIHKTYNSRRLLALNENGSKGPSLLANEKQASISTEQSIEANQGGKSRASEKTVEKRQTNIIAFEKTKDDYYKYLPSESPGYDSREVDVMDHSFQVLFSDIRCACAIYTDLASTSKNRKPTLFVEISVERDGVDTELLCTKSCSELARIRMETKQEVHCSHLKGEDNNSKEMPLPEYKPDAEIIICQVFTGESEPALHFILSWLNVVLVDVVVCLSGLSIVCMYLICFVSWKRRDSAPAYTTSAFGSK